MLEFVKIELLLTEGSLDKNAVSAHSKEARVHVQPPKTEPHTVS